MNTMYTMVGISATGKGTRMSTLIEFLKTKSPNYESIFLNSVNGQIIKKPYQIALRFPDLNITFFGRYVRSNKIGRMISWSSLDSFSAYKEHYSTVAKLFSNGIYCSEGYFGGKCDFHRPQQAKIAGFDIVRTDHFLHGNIENLQERCKGRSGNYIKGSCFGDDNYFTKKEENKTKWLTQIYTESTEVSLLSCEYKFHSADESVYAWGAKVIIESLPQLDYSEFIEWAKENNTLRHVDNAQANIDKYSKYLEGDSKNIKYIELPTLVENKELPL